MLSKGFYNGLAHVLTVMSGLVASVILTRLLGPEKWGIYNQLSWLIGFTGMFLALGLTYSSERYFGVVSESDDFSEAKPLAFYFGSIQFLSAVTGSVLLFIFAVDLVNLIDWKIDSELVRLAAAGTFSFALLQLGMAMLRGLQEFRKLSILSLGLALISFGTVLATWLIPSVRTLIIATAIGQIAIVFWLARMILARVSCENSPSLFDWLTSNPTWRSVLRYSFVILVITIVDQVVWERSEIFFLAKLDDARQSGYYALAFTVSRLGIGVIPVALTGILTPVFSSLHGTVGQFKLRQEYKRAFSFLNLILLPSSIGLAAIAPDLVLLLYGPEYVGMVPVVRLLVVSTAIGLYTRPSASIIQALDKPSIQLLASLIALPVDLWLASRLVWSWQAVGAAVANVSAQLVGGSIIVGYGVIFIGLDHDWISATKSLASAVLCGGVAWLITITVPTPSWAVSMAVTAGGAVYLSALLVLQDKPTRELLYWLRRRLSSHLSNFS